MSMRDAVDSVSLRKGPIWFQAPSNHSLLFFCSIVQNSSIESGAFNPISMHDCQDGCRSCLESVGLEWKNSSAHWMLEIQYTFPKYSTSQKYWNTSRLCSWFTITLLCSPPLFLLNTLWFSILKQTYHWGREIIEGGCWYSCDALGKCQSLAETPTVWVSLQVGAHPGHPKVLVFSTSAKSGKKKHIQRKTALQME